MLKVDYDPVRKLIVTEASGFLTVDEVHGWASALKSCMVRARADGDIRHLVLGADASIQSTEIMELFMAQRLPPTSAGDRMAVVIGSALGKMQADRNLPSDQERSFASEAEAMAWLMAAR